MSNIIPISFSIPECKLQIADNIDNKRTLLSSIIPGDYNTYIQNEEDYYNEYKSSYFARTNKKGGWDCLRHYEILACGCVPLFTDLHDCPQNTLTHLRKDLLFEARDLYEEMKNGINDENLSKYKILRDKLMQNIREHLVGNKMAKYVLEMTNHAAVSKILFLSGDLSPDYLRCLTLIGFKELMGGNCHDYPRVPHIYKDCQNAESIYGRGMTYTKIFDVNLHDYYLDESIEQDIRDLKYDIIIYGSYTRGMPFYDLVRTHYSPEKIILLCGEDVPCDFQPYINNCHHYFLREIY